MSASNSSRGFTLLEAIFALALIGLTGTALFSWLDTTLISASRVREINGEALLTLDALALVEKINPMQSPEGTLEAAPLTVQWKSRQLPPLRDTASAEDAESAFQVAMYEIDVVATGARNTTARFTLHSLGWKR